MATRATDRPRRAPTRAVERLLRGPARRWLPRRTVRLRLTTLYGSLFLLAGALLLTITYLLVASHLGGSNVMISADRTTGQRGITRQVETKAQLFYSSGGLAATVPAGGQVLSPSAGTLPVPEVLRSASRAASALLKRQRSTELNQLLLWSGTALAIMALASVALGWLIAGRVLAPLRTMTAAARRISADNLDQRLALAGPDDELKELGDTIDGLLARLEHAFDAERRFVANASHELRTPLTLERAMIEVALADPDANVASLRAVCERVLAAGQEQESLIEALLTLARTQRGIEHREPLALENVVGEALPAVPREPPAPQIASALNAAPVSGDRRLVGRLVANLLDNAIRHNVPGGWVHVATRTRDARATLRVVNSGPLIPVGDERILLEPFRRAARDRSSHGNGHGLGLSIAAAIATAHGADLSVRARTEGGLDVEVSFPSPSRRAGWRIRPSLSTSPVPDRAPEVTTSRPL